MRDEQLLVLIKVIMICTKAIVLAVAGASNRASMAYEELEGAEKVYNHMLTFQATPDLVGMFGGE